MRQTRWQVRRSWIGGIPLSALVAALIAGCAGQAPGPGDPALRSIVGTFTLPSDGTVGLVLAGTVERGEDPITFGSTTFGTDGAFEMALPDGDAVPAEAMAPIMQAFDIYVESFDLGGCASMASAPDVRTTIVGFNARSIYSVALLAVDLAEGVVDTSTTDEAPDPPDPDRYSDPQVFWVYADGATTFRGPEEGCVVGAGYRLFADVTLTEGWNQLARAVEGTFGERIVLRNDDTASVIVERIPEP